MPDGTVLAFDFGEKRIGVATGETLLGSAHPLTVIRAETNDDRFAAIGKLIAEWQPVQLVVGLPTHADGTPHEMTRLATKFGERLKRRFNLPVGFADERLTSLDAERGCAKPAATASRQAAARCRGGPTHSSNLVRKPAPCHPCLIPCLTPRRSAANWPT